MSTAAHTEPQKYLDPALTFQLLDRVPQPEGVVRFSTLLPFICCATTTRSTHPPSHCNGQFAF
jgi:hypothetical protein